MKVLPFVCGVLCLLLVSGCSRKRAVDLSSSDDVAETPPLADHPLIERYPGILTHVGVVIHRAKGSGDASLTEDWPSDLTYVNKKLDAPLDSLERYHEVLATMPKSMLEGYRIGQTLETNGCFLTSIDPGNSEAKESLWIMVVGAKIGGDAVFSNSIW